MLLPQLHDELTRVASSPHPVLRFSGRTVSALSAALIALLLTAPVAQGQLIATIATNHLRGVL